jgi:hypothetical protein
MRGYEPELLVEFPGFRTLLVGGELYQVATTLLCAADSPAEELPAKAQASVATVNPNSFEGGTPTPLVRDVWSESQLQHPRSDSIFCQYYDEFVVRVLLNGFEGARIRWGQWVLEPLTPDTQRILCQHTNDRWEIIGNSVADARRRIRHGARPH